MKSKGFTLIEVVIVIAVVGVLMVALLGLFLNNSRLFNYQTQLIKTTSVSRQILAELTENALQASRVLQNQTVNGVVYNSGPATVIFQLPSVDASGNALPNTYDYVVFANNGATLVLDAQADPTSSRKTYTKTLSTSINSFALTYDNIDWTKVQNVTAEFTNREMYRNQNIDQSIKAVLHLRNY